MDYHICSPLRHGRRPQAYIIPSEAKKKKKSTSSSESGIPPQAGI